MFDNLDLFLQGKSSLKVDKTGKPSNRDLQIATTVLLVRMAGIDENFSLGEVEALLHTLQKQFNVGPIEAGELIEVAKFLQQDKTKMKSLLHIINERFEDSQKQTILAMMWKVMKADGLVTRVEATFAAKVAKALKLTREQVMAAQDMVETGEV